MNNVYEKPKMHFVPLRNDEKIANKCWGNHGTGYEYYDTHGSGFVGFTIANGSCTTEDQLQVVFYKDKNDKTGTPVYPGNPQYDEFYQALLDASEGGSYGQPFKGEEKFPDDPGGMS